MLRCLNSEIGSWPHQAMAERSGFPELDQAIEQFMQSYPDIECYRDPQNAWGQCEQIADDCAAFLKQRGFKAYAPRDELGAFPGYQDAQDSAAIGAGDFSYPEHAMVEVYGLFGPNNVNTVTIDFTASQYGFTEFPKVHGGPADQQTFGKLADEIPAEDPDYFYHLAPTEERDRIQTHGLHPSTPMYGGRWGSGDIDCDNCEGEDYDPNCEYCHGTGNVDLEEHPELSEVADQPTGIYAWGAPVPSEQYTGEHMDMWRIPRSATQGAYMEQHQGTGEAGRYVIPHHVSNPELHVPYEDAVPEHNWRRDEGAYWNSPERNPQWGIGKPNRVWGKLSVGEIPAVLFHGAPVAARNQIRRQGLVAGAEWGVVYLAKSPTEALNYEEDLWQVTTAGLQLDWEGDYFTTSFVPPQNLKLIKGYDAYTDPNTYSKTSAWGVNYDELIPEQRALLEGGGERKERQKRWEEYQRNMVPGTRIWRGEYDRQGAPEDQEDIGMHWSLEPGAAGNFSHWGNPIIWQATMGNPATQAYPQGTSMWGGDKRSLDWEHEVRMRPNAQLDVEGYWKPKGDADPSGPFWQWSGWPHEKSHGPDGWEFVPMGKQLPVVNRGSIAYPSYDNDSPEKMWEQHEREQGPSGFDQRMDRSEYNDQHIFQGNPWGIGFSGPRPFAQAEPNQEWWDAIRQSRRSTVRYADPTYPMGFGDMYHVSPRQNREQILREGLRGHEREQVGSPWGEGFYDKHQQPAGNYLFDNPEDAHDYIYNIHSRQRGLADRNEWNEDRWVYPEPPPGFYDWDEARQDEWHDKALPISLEDDPNGYDIWRVQSHGLPMGPDPETRLVNMPEPFDLGNVYDVYQEQREGWLPAGTPVSLDELHNDVGGYYGTEPKRYYIPQEIHPNRVQLHEHVPSWNLTQEDNEERYENADDRQYPTPWSQLPFTEVPFPGHESKAFDDDLADYANRRYNEQGTYASTTFTTRPTASSKARLAPLQAVRHGIQTSTTAQAREGQLSELWHFSPLAASNDPAEMLMAKHPQWVPAPYTGASNHRRWFWTDQNGTPHQVGAGSGTHSSDDSMYDALKLRTRLRRCEGGACECGKHLGSVTGEALTPEEEAELQAQESQAPQRYNPNDSVMFGGEHHYVQGYEPELGMYELIHAQTGAPDSASHEELTPMEPQAVPQAPQLQQVAKMIRVSDKLHDFLMNPKSRPDLQTPEAQKFLQHLERHYHNDKTDALMPWLTREWKKGRIGYTPPSGPTTEFDSPELNQLTDLGRQPETPGLIWQDPEAATAINPEGRRALLNPGVLNHWADFLQSTHPIRRGLGDIMQHPINDFQQQVMNWTQAMEEAAERKALEGGKVVHQTPDGYTVRQLTTPDELKAEGNAMGHCVGSYADAVKSGDSLIYSLRDAKGYPHTTLEIEPNQTTGGDYDHEWLERLLNGQPHYPEKMDRVTPAVLKQPEAVEGLRNYHDANEEWALGMRQTFEPEELEWQGLYNELQKRHGYTRLEGLPQGGQVIQIQGRSDNDANIKPEYKAALKNWFDTFSPEDKPKWGEGFYGDELEDARDIKPEDLDPSGVDEYGLQPYKTPVNWGALVQSTIQAPHWSVRPSRPYDYQLGQNVYQLAKNRGKIRSLHAALEPFGDEQQENFDNWLMQNDHMAPWPQTNTGDYNNMGDEEREQAWQQAQDDWRDEMAQEHPGMQATQHMYSLLKPHWNPITNRYENDIYQDPATEFGLDKMQRPGDNDQEVFG